MLLVEKQYNVAVAGLGKEETVFYNIPQSSIMDFSKQLLNQAGVYEVRIINMDPKVNPRLEQMGS